MMHCPKPLGLLRNALNRFPSQSFLICLLFQVSATQAIGLGSIQSQSALGQPLRVIIPLSLQSGEEVGCVRVSGGSADLPAPINPRHTVLERNQSVRLEITTPQAMNEPVLNLVVTVGCAASITRNYVLLLDPPEIAELATAASSSTAGTVRSKLSPNAAVVGDTPPAASTRTVSSRAPVRSKRNKRQSSVSSVASGGVSAATQSVLNTALAAKPAQAKSRAVQTPKVAKSAAQVSATPADRLVLSSQMQGTPLRLSADLPAADQRPAPDPEKVSELRQQQERMTAELNEQDPFVIMAAREAALASRVQRLTDEAANLQKQIDALRVRNKSLERTRLPAYLVWILGALALGALCIVAWFASRYRMLQQSTSGKPWWTSANADASKPAPEVRSTSTQKSAPREFQESISNPTTPRKAATLATLAASNKPIQRTRPISTDTLIPLGTATTGHTQSNVLPPASAFELTEYDAGSTDNGFSEPGGSSPHPVKDVQPQEERSYASTLIASVPSAEPDKPIASVPGDHEKIDFMLDLTASEQARMSNTLDFSIATVIGSPPAENESVQSATESFFAEMSVPDATKSVIDPLPKIEMPVVKEAVHDDGQDPTHTVPIQGPLNLEKASLHFRLIQFASVIEQIEELLQKSDSTHAITLLRRYVLREEEVPTLMWLMLLEEYRKTNKRPVYSALSEHFARRYKRPMLSWNEALADKTPQITLAQYPEVDENIKRLWGTHKGLDLINSYITGTNQSDAIVFNALLQRELLQMVKNYPLDDSTGI